MENMWGARVRVEIIFPGAKLKAEELDKKLLDLLQVMIYCIRDEQVVVIKNKTGWWLGAGGYMNLQSGIF